MFEPEGHVADSRGLQHLDTRPSRLKPPFTHEPATDVSISLLWGIGTAELLQMCRMSAEESEGCR